MLAIAGGKGGCGKTTTALGLATALARDGAAPVVVDADRDSPDLHLLADVDPSPDLADAVPDQPLSVVHESSVFPGVSVVPAPSGTLPDGRFHVALDGLAAVDRSVVVDCPAGAGRDAVVPLRASDTALLATTLHPPSLRDAAKTAAMARRLDVELAGSVLTRVPAWAFGDRDGPDPGAAGDALRPEIVRRVERLLDAPVVGQVPAMSGAGREVLGHPDVRASYARLARTLPGGEHLSSFVPKTA